jgi:hypothetical protein
MTGWTLMEILSDLLADTLWLEMDRIYLFATVTAPVCHLSSFWIKCGLPFLPKGWDIHKIKIGSRHGRNCEL